MVQRGAKAILVRVTNDDKTAWKLSPEEAAVFNRQEAEQAAKILGFQEVVSMGYRAHELADVPFTSLRDRLILDIRHYRPTAMFIPNPYAEYDRVHETLGVRRGFVGRGRAKHRLKGNNFITNIFSHKPFSTANEFLRIAGGILQRNMDEGKEKILSKAATRRRYSFPPLCIPNVSSISAAVLIQMIWLFCRTAKVARKIGTIRSCPKGTPNSGCPVTWRTT
jgi:hypothetical protein